MKVNSELTQYEGVEGVKSLALVFVNYDFTEFFTLFPPWLADLARDRNNLLKWMNTRKVFWKYLGSVFSLVICQLLSVWEVSLTPPFAGRSGVLFFGWTIFLKSHAPSPSRNFQAVLGCTAPTTSPASAPGCWASPLCCQVLPGAACQMCTSPTVGPERGETSTASERGRQKRDKRGWHEPSGSFILDSLCVPSSCLELPVQPHSWGFLRIRALG